MKIVQLEQQSPEWRRWRRQHLGASDAPAILGISPYTTREELLARKVSGEELPVNYAMQQGVYNEARVRLHWQGVTGLTFEPICVEHHEVPWLAASLDGYHAESRTVLEVKCPNWRDHDYAVCGLVPPHYYAQCQHALFVTDAQELHYVSCSLKPNVRFSKEQEIVGVTVLPDAEYMAMLLDAEERFWNELQERLHAIDTGDRGRDRAAVCG